MPTDIDYWASQLTAVLDKMEPATSVDPERGAETTIAVSLVNTSARSARAELIRALERRGFKIVSASRESPIRVDATADRLRHSYAEVEA
jgi:hypothetical protein